MTAITRSGEAVSPDVLARDLEEIDWRLEKAKTLTAPAYVKLPTYHPEYFPLFDIAGHELKAKGLIVNWRAHLAGLRHKTVNAIFLTRDGDLILQRRSPTTILFPSRCTLSAGGHLSYPTPDRTGSISPLRQLVVEVQEELGLTMVPQRFIPLGDAYRGIPNFLHVWTFQHDGIAGVVTVSDPCANDIGVSVGPKNTKTLPDAARAVLTQLVREETLGHLSEDALEQHGLTLFTRNVELCHFYTVLIGEKEIDSIQFTDGEVAGFRRVPLGRVVQEARCLDTTTDSLYTLFYGRDDIAAELCQRVREGGTHL